MKSSRTKILAVLSEGQPRSHREVVKESGLEYRVVGVNLYRSWKAGLVLRTKKPLFESEKVFKGRAGSSRTTRPYHLYVLKPDGANSLRVDGNEFVSYSEEHLDVRGGGRKSKAQMVLDFLRRNKDRAWFSTEISEELKENGVRIGDIMPNVRRFERKGLVYVRGYKLEDRQTPFKEGYLLTWLDVGKSREEVIGEAIRRTNKVLKDRSSTNPVIERVQRTRDVVIEHSKLRRIVGLPYIKNKLSCSVTKLDAPWREFFNSTPIYMKLGSSIITGSSIIQVSQKRT